LEFFAPTRVLAGIERRSFELGLSLQLGLLDHVNPACDTARAERVMNDLLSRQVDGIIWAVPGHADSSEWVAAMFGEIPVPVVFVNTCSSPNREVVAMDNRHGGRLGTEHLLAQGYRRIGIISGPPRWWESEEREAGWRSAMMEAGIADLEDLRAEGDWSAASGEAAFDTLYRHVRGIEAVFASNDQMAQGALQVARRLGLDVPGDVAVVGFDDIPEAAYFCPPLTTVRQDVKALGALAVERIYSMISARQREEVYQTGVSWLVPRLIVRESSVRE